MSDEKYLKIRINSVHPHRTTTFDLFVLINGKHVLYRRAGERLTEAKLEKLASFQSDVFYIMNDDLAAYKSYIHTQVSDQSLPTKERAIVLRESSFSLVEELFEHPDVNKALEGSKSLISDFIQFMDNETEGLENLIGLSSHDFYTYNHSLDVSIYSLGLGKIAGYTDPKELHDLGRGALLHDIGKRNVSIEIITKKGPLSDVEWAQMRNHPAFGIQILNPNADVTDGMKACVFEHHENCAGNGYPQQLLGEEIHPMARIVALTDTYDALTTKRSYNEPMNPTDALNFMKDKLSGRFDPDLMQALYSVLFRM